MGLNGQWTDTLGFWMYLEFLFPNFQRQCYNVGSWESGWSYTCVCLCLPVHIDTHSCSVLAFQDNLQRRLFSCSICPPKDLLFWPVTIGQNSKASLAHASSCIKSPHRPDLILGVGFGDPGATQRNLNFLQAFPSFLRSIETSTETHHELWCKNC